jgi:hypothetical protein
MNRREFIALVGGAAAAWPLTARAQQPVMPVVGYLSVGAPPAHLLAVFKQSLAEAGFVEGRNVAIETPSADGRYDRLPALAADLVRRQVAVIVDNYCQSGARRQGCDRNNTDRLQRSRGSRRAWSGRQHCAARRQCDRRELPIQRPCGKAPRATA